MIRRQLKFILALSSVAALAAVLAAPAGAAFGVRAFDGQSTADAAGSPFTQAGGHPYELWTQIDYNLMPDGNGGETPDGNVKTNNVYVPHGLIGNLTGIPTCTETQLATFPNSCPAGSQVGYAEVDIALLSKVATGIYNQEPPPGYSAAFAFTVFGGGIVHILPRVVDEGGYRLRLDVSNISASYALRSSRIVLWGTPADPAHDQFRGPGFSCFGGGPTDPGSFCSGGGYSAETPERAFLTLPSDCSAGPFETTLEYDSWQNPGQMKRIGFDSHLPPAHPLPPDQWGPPQGVTGCEDVPFSPSLELLPGNSNAGAPSPLSVDLRVPQEGFTDPDAVAAAHVKDVEVVLPEGVAVNPSVANGLAGCAPAQIALENDLPADCPGASRIGSVRIDTPLLEHPLEGGVFLATQNANPFNSLLAMYIAVDDPASGTVLKLPGKVSPNPATGQLTVTFADNPQLPYERLRMELHGGSRAPLTMPQACGTYTTQARITSWARQAEAVPSASSFTIDRGCETGGQFTPRLEAGVANPFGGEHSAFSLRVTRPDGQQNVAGIEATLPKGLLAKLAGVPLCGDAAVAGGSCPAGSRIGSATVGTGAGVNPVYVPQPGKAPTAVFLAGPYKGAPYSIVVSVPAQAGPFDLGTVIVRNALRIDPTTAQVTVQSDSLPQFLQGIPLTYRDLRFEIDRASFVLNPTSCAKTQVSSSISSAAGQVATPSSSFQVADCANLGFKPKLDLKLSGPTKRATYPKLRAVMTARKGQANISRVSVALPRSAFLAQEHIKTICTRVQYAADKCPKGSVYGYARAVTPLLDKPLVGPVYLRSSSNKLPDLVADLNGAIEIDLAGRIDSVNGGIRTTFESVPDAPVSRFVLEMKGGKKGLLVNSRDLCGSTNRAQVKMDGQNGKVHDFAPVVQPSCKGKKEGSGRG